MSKTEHFANKIGVVFYSALVVVLTGCTSYQEQPRSRGDYYEASPQVDSSYYVGIRSENDFYEPLSLYGRWEVVGSYGRCWIPGRVDRDWRPYSNGYWQHTDAGWYWASDEPWGWATYHYGRWDLDPQFGWYWVPQTRWAPAWVSWHHGGGYVGWAPLSPSGRVDVRILSPRAFVFVEERRFLEPIRPTTVVVNTTTIINKTVINKGPPAAAIEKVTGHKIQPVQVRELRHKEEAPVAGQQRIVAPASEKKDKQVQPAVRREVKTPEADRPREKKATPARAPRQAEPPAVTAPVPEAPPTKKAAPSRDQQPPARPQARPNEEERVRKEAKPEPQREARPQVEQRNQHEAQPPAERSSRPEAKPETKRAGKPEAVQPSKREAKPPGKPDSEQLDHEQDNLDKDSGTKGKGHRSP
jgi:hypothetical protein